jgi:DNA polymerase-3 subunit delta
MAVFGVPSVPLYLFYGDESYLLLREIRQLRQRVVTNDLAQLSHKTLKNPSLAQVIEAVGAVSFNFGGETLIEIHDFAYLSKAAGGKGDEAALEDLKGILDTLEPAKHVMFASQKLDRKIKFPKWLAGHKEIVSRECKKLNFWQTDEAVQFLMAEARQRQMSLEPPAAAKLVEMMGVELQALVNELEKLSIYADGRNITVADVLTLSNHPENTFDMLAHWVHGRNRQEVYRILEELLLRQHPVQLFALTQTYINNVFQLRYLQGQGLPESEIAARAKKHPFRVKQDLKEFGRVPFERLMKLKQTTLDLEWKFKTGQIGDRLAFELLMGA